MPEDIMDRLNRLANAGRKPEPKREFVMPNSEPQFKREKGTLCKMLDEVDIKQIGRVR